MAEAVRLAPGDPAALIRLAFAEHGAGQSADAVRHLQDAARLTGAEAFPHAGALGILLAQAGRGAEAMPWLARARAGEGDFAEARLQLARVQAAAGARAEARAALLEALRADPALRARAARDPHLRPLLP
jgi:tetratricopeptide (TPR) repeat protein